jgi:hypothetical protein
MKTRLTGGPHPLATTQRGEARLLRRWAELGCSSAGPAQSWSGARENQASAPTTIGPPGKEGKLFFFFFIYLFSKTYSK